MTCSAANYVDLRIPGVSTVLMPRMDDCWRRLQFRCRLTCRVTDKREHFAFHEFDSLSRQAIANQSNTTQRIVFTRQAPSISCSINSSSSSLFFLLLPPLRISLHVSNSSMSYLSCLRRNFQIEPELVDSTRSKTKPSESTAEADSSSPGTIKFDCRVLSTAAT